MEPGFDLLAEARAAAVDADSALRFAGRLAAAAGRSLAPDDGYPDSVLEKAQERLGVALPGLLVRLHETVGRRDDLVRVQDRLLAPHELSIDATGTVLQWRVENQGCAWWGIPLDSLGHADPPVLVRAITGSDQEHTWYPYLDRLSLAIEEMLLSESLFAGHDGTWADNMELEEASLRVLEAHFERLPIPDCPMWTDPSAGVVWRWFAGPSVVLREDAGTWVWVLAQSEQAVDDVRTLLPGDWLMRPDG